MLIKANHKKQFEEVHTPPNLPNLFKMVLPRNHNESMNVSCVFCVDIDNFKSGKNAKKNP